MEISYLLIGRFPMRRYEYNARWLLEVCTELEGRNFLGGLPSAEYPLTSENSPSTHSGE
jgi:hypothetical protein